jgi:GNAT superfamily N-acetyltransferase
MPVLVEPDEQALTPALVAPAWALGWSLSRATGAPLARQGYVEIAVNLPDQLKRYVLPDFDAALIQRLAQHEAQPLSWLKICAETVRVLPLLRPGWSVHAPEFLMGTVLQSQSQGEAPGYTVGCAASGPLLSVELRAADGELAASGHAVVTRAYATFDRIITAEAHRRRGLGRLIMQALTAQCLQRGARYGVLVATEQGRQLYQALGWALVSPMFAASFQPAAQA